jgi:uncharacterized membrane protein
MMQDKRYGFIDSVRGLILVLMALDHTSVFWNGGRVAWEGLPVFERGTLTFLFPHTDSLAQSVTRFVTHVCAPSFIFLAGMMIAFSSARRDTDDVGRKKFSGYLLRRGIFFVFLEVTLIQLIWGYNLFLYPPPGNESFLVISFGIISLFGFLFIIMSFLHRMPTIPLLAFCVLVLAGYWVLFPSLALWTYEVQSNLLLDVAPIIYLPIEFGTHSITTGIYPVIPWISVAIFGLLYGRLLCGLRKSGSIGDWKKYSFGVGFGLLILFSAYEYVMDVRFSKYPPSLGFLSLTLGVILLLLGIVQLLEEKGIYLGIIQTYGRVPFFFSNIHLFLYSLIPSLTGTYAGFSLLTTYFVWLCGLVILFFPCRWYYNFKQRHRNSFFKYI